MGHLQSRIQHNGRVQVRDRGTTVQLIAVPAHSGMTDILVMLHSWHDQAGLHAVVQAPILAIQLNRFGPSRSGGAKVHTAFEVLYPTIMMPLFDGAGLSLNYVPYQLDACLIHDGSQAHQGHYRALLRAADGWCLKDDAKVASILIHVAAQSLVATRCYILIYHRLRQ